MKHICILICYNNVDHIKKCFTSLKNNNVDFFIIENKSKNSDEIQKYFLTQKIIGYIQFEQNITFKAVEIFIKEYEPLMREYDIITVSDCDLYVENSVDTFNELVKNLNFDNIGVSCVDLCLKNFPNSIPGSDSWLPNKTNETDEYIECATGIHLCTIKKENLFLFKQTFLDNHIHTIANQSGLRWVKTKKSKAIHLTWDLYSPGNEYFEFKKNNNLWNHSLTCNYITIL